MREKNINETTIIQNVIGKERIEVDVYVYKWDKCIEMNIQFFF